MLAVYGECLVPSKFPDAGFYEWIFSTRGGKLTEDYGRGQLDTATRKE